MCVVFLMFLSVKWSHIFRNGTTDITVQKMQAVIFLSKRVIFGGSVVFVRTGLFFLFNDHSNHVYLVCSSLYAVT